jgi:adenylate cyclase
MFSKRKAYYLLIGFFFFIVNSTIGQDQKLADSLAIIYKKGELADTAKLELLRNLAFNEHNDLKLAVKYAEELIALSRKLGNDVYLSRGLIQKGNKERIMGNLEAALNAYFKAVEAARKANFTAGEATAYNTIADVYSISKNHPNAMLYYHKAISALRESKDSVRLATALSNAGDELLNNRNYDSALVYFEEAALIFEKSDYLIGKAYTLGNIGMVYASTGKNELAEKNINEAIPILEESENYYPICVYLISMCDIYTEKGENSRALNYAERSLKLAQQFGLKEQISNANLKLSELYEKTGNQGRSFKYYRDHIAYRDSVNNIKSVQQMADLRTNFEVSQKQTEVDLLTQEKRNQQIIVAATIIAMILIFLLLMGVYKRYTFMKKTNVIIEEEKKKSDILLRNILPEETAKELKMSGKVQAKKFNSVTVLFTDFKDFTHYATSLPPEQLVETVDFYFSRFDQIMNKYGLEKIKTVGDAYMCAGGLPFPSEDHAHKMVQAALEIATFVQDAKQQKADGEIRFDIRIGINTGPIVAGVVGSTKFAYDIWGDTVNIASRMESNSELGKINISENTYELVKEHFDCQYRGEINVKNRGMLKMYFVNKPASQLNDPIV